MVRLGSLAGYNTMYPDVNTPPFSAVSGSIAWCDPCRRPARKRVRQGFRECNGLKGDKVIRQSAVSVVLKNVAFLLLREPRLFVGLTLSFDQIFDVNIHVVIR